MAEESEFVYYKLNVRVSTGVRMFPGDADGVLLSPRGTNTVAVPKNKLRDFKNANKRLIIEGAIVPTEEPSMDWETTNALTDEDVNELLKNYMKLKSTLQTLDSLPILYKMIETAKEKEMSNKTISLINSRIAELEPEEKPIFRKDDMQGSHDV